MFTKFLLGMNGPNVCSDFRSPTKGEWNTTTHYFYIFFDSDFSVENLHHRHRPGRQQPPTSQSGKQSGIKWLLLRLRDSPKSLNPNGSRLSSKTVRAS